MEEINVIEIKPNRTIHQMDNVLAFYNFEGTHFVGKLDYIKRNLESLVGTRWKDKEELEKYLREKYEIESSLNEVDESGLVADYAFIMGIFKDWGYMDIYYLKIPYGSKTIHITEVSVSEE